ncbi:MAG: ABC transporter substrate-binding protein [Actinomycetes bacterium]
MTPRFLQRRRASAAAAVTLAVALALTACSSSSAAPAASGDAGSPSAAPVTTLRVGFFPNLTHAPAYVALQEGYFKDSLGQVGVKVAPTLFNAGPEAVTALFADSIDIAYVGPNPTVQAWTQSKGEAVTVISGAASAGAALVVSSDITSAADLKGKTIATPQLGNTQDVAAKYWLKQQGYNVSSDGSGDVTVINASNSDIVTAFQNGDISGAWVPEPYATSLEQSGGKVLVDEASLWPKGQFVTTDVVVRSQFLADHPDVVEAFLTANVEALKLIDSDPAQAKSDFNAGLQSLTGSPLDTALLDAAWKNVTFTADPLKATLEESAAHAVDVGLLDQSEIDAAGGFDGLYDLTLLNKVLKQQKLDQVAS